MSNYYKHDDNGLTLILWQVDDFLIANTDDKVCDKIRAQIQKRMTNPLNILGTIRKFNGIHVEQTCDYNHLHCATYIEKIVSHHGWEHEVLRKRPTAMNETSPYQKRIQMDEGSDDTYEAEKLEKLMGYSS